MKVRELRKKLEGLPDEADIIVSVNEELGEGWLGCSTAEVSDVTQLEIAEDVADPPVVMLEVTLIEEAEAV